MAVSIFRIRVGVSGYDRRQNVQYSGTTGVKSKACPYSLSCPSVFSCLRHATVWTTVTLHQNGNWLNVSPTSGYFYHHMFVVSQYLGTSVEFMVVAPPGSLLDKRGQEKACSSQSNVLQHFHPRPGNSLHPHPAREMSEMSVILCSRRSSLRPRRRGQ